jgi:hypothetical protein
MTRNELEKSLLRLEWEKKGTGDAEKWDVVTNLYYKLRIKKEGQDYYVYKVVPDEFEYLVSPIECNSIEEAKQLAWKIYVDTIETFFKA